jgi:hypothetical protein
MKLKTLILIGALSVAGGAYAQEGGGGGGGAGGPGGDARAAMQKACAADMASLCPGMTGRDANMCLRAATDKVSAGCKDAMSKMPARGGGGGGGGPPQG